MTALTSKRIKTIIAECEAEKELVRLLRYHKIPFSMSEGDAFPLKVPTKKGSVLILRNRSRFEIHGPAPVPYNPNNI